MNFDFIKAIVELVQQFTEQNEDGILYSNDLQGFKKWMNDSFKEDSESENPLWIGKQSGRSSDSVINTLLVRIGRYAKMYSRSIGKSFFSSQDDFIYLISLKTMGGMTKMELIKHNASEKSSGVLIINRLIHNQWIEQTVSSKDKRTKHIHITDKGLAVLEEHMDEIRKASKVVAGNLTHAEQMLLITILSKLDEFHYSLYRMNFEVGDLIEAAYKKLN
ncbi:DNA-binding MarR family transcriptional regulator [Chryseobacterium bernardetii]|uniref:DNA-binding MarR family transcriptional regulator n=2 Tax=Chryseobacterium TaxID=59732 RepID=A0A543EIE6_9FLAO|nr:MULTISPECIES: MarR family winged helix-turn-helix transcriptional regulator [Chryseobacterium]MDR6369799.1 DNA-binding MarR family transcriptional regulator [Chryseobacterium vietnamense]MDR6440958.1 DNA-binding MarR family transcriptional regulator [Chryseobacterium bernardetii]TQM21362.1 DNA-binding MarR family transcriptional regulator [Chryseobacterium aquifrigidense]